MKKPSFEFSSVRGRLLAWIMLVALVPMILLVAFGLTYAEKALQARALQDLTESAYRLHEDISERVIKPMETARVFSRSPYLKQALRDFSSVFEADNLYSMDYQDMQDRYWMYFSLYAEEYQLSDLLLLNAKGQVVFSAVQSDLYGASITHVDYAGTGTQAAYKQAMWQMDTTVAFARNHRTADSFAYIASPVVGDALLGTVVMIPDARLLRKLVQSQTYGGQVVDIFYATSEGSFQSQIDGTTIDRSTELGRSLLRASLGQDINRETSFWDGEWLTHIRAVPTIQAVMVLRRDRDIVLQSVQELRYGGWGVTLIAILLTVLISRRLSINLAAPIRALSDSIERITEGDREVSVDVNRKDELGALAQQFNHMATSLRDTQAQLVQTEKMASIGHLAAGIAHEINNPMSVVTANMNTMKEYAETYVKLADLFAQYLNPQDESEREDSRTTLEAFEKEEDIDFVHQDMKALLQDSQLGLSRVQHIVSSLKIFSELDKSEEQDIDLRQTLEQVVSDIAPAASRSTEITYQIELEGSIRVKPEQMQKVFAAVIDNALKACTEKGSLRIKAWRENKTLMIDFQDTGCGMSGEQVTKVFDPFYTTRDVGEGVGLGLSIAHAIVEAHNGTVKVASKEGRGTRIRLVLPQR